jgi:hypothetical protein
MFIGLAQATGGLIYFGAAEEVGNVFDMLEYELRDDFVTIQRSKHILSGSITALIPVDDTLTSIIFTATSYEASISSVEIVQPDGTILDSSSHNVSISKIGDNEVITVLEPSVGIWQMKVGGTGPVTIVAQGNSPISINFFQFVTDDVPMREGYQYVEVSGGNPTLDGKKSTVLTRVDGLVSDYTFILLDDSGVVLPNLVDIDTRFIATSGELLLSFTTPAQTFGIAVSGVTAAGKEYKRLAKREYLPQTIKVSFNHWSRPLALPGGKNTTVQFIVENFRNESVVLDIDANDDQMFVSSLSPTQVELTQNSSEIINVTLLPPVDCNISSVVSVSVTATVSGEILGMSETAELSHACEDEPPPITVPPVTSSPVTTRPSYKPTDSRSAKSAKSSSPVTSQNVSPRPNAAKSEKKPTKEPKVSGYEFVSCMM